LLSSINRGAQLSRERRVEQFRRIESEKLERSLTSRREVFALITTGLLNKQVAANSEQPSGPSRRIAQSVMSKMGAGSLADLVRMAGILQIHAPSKTLE